MMKPKPSDHVTILIYANISVISAFQCRRGTARKLCAYGRANSRRRPGRPALGLAFGRTNLGQPQCFSCSARQPSMLPSENTHCPEIVDGRANTRPRRVAALPPVKRVHAPRRSATRNPAAIPTHTRHRAHHLQPTPMSFEWQWSLGGAHVPQSIAAKAHQLAPRGRSSASFMPRSANRSAVSKFLLRFAPAVER